MVEGSRRRRPRRSGVEAEQLAQLTARRDALDQEQVRRREREDEALAQYAAAVARVQAINDERDRRAADLAKQLTQLHDQAKADVAAVEREQAAALVVLNELGRSADDLAKLTGCRSSGSGQCCGLRGRSRRPGDSQARHGRGQAPRRPVISASWRAAGRRVRPRVWGRRGRHTLCGDRRDTGETCQVVG